MAKETSPLDERYGRRLRAIREERGLTLAQLVGKMQRAGVAYMNTSTLSRIETGVRPVRLTEAQTIARILRVSVDSMTEAFEELAFIESQAGDAREQYVRFRQSVVKVTSAQIRLRRYIPELRDMLTGADKDLAETLEGLIRNLESYVEIDLPQEAANFRDETLAEDENRSDTPAGQFLKYQNG